METPFRVIVIYKRKREREVTRTFGELTHATLQSGQEFKRGRVRADTSRDLGTLAYIIQSNLCRERAHSRYIYDLDKPGHGAHFETLVHTFVYAHIPAGETDKLISTVLIHAASTTVRARALARTRSFGVRINSRALPDSATIDDSRIANIYATCVPRDLPLRVNFSTIIINPSVNGTEALPPIQPNARGTSPLKVRY